MNKQDNALEVWLEDELGSARQIGTLAHDRDQIRFHYERDWLRDPRAFALDPDLSLDEFGDGLASMAGSYSASLTSSAAPCVRACGHAMAP